MARLKSSQVKLMNRVFYLLTQKKLHNIQPRHTSSKSTFSYEGQFYVLGVYFDFR